MTASKNYIDFSDESITYRNNVKDTHSYAWDEVELLVYSRDDGQFKFQFHDGNALTITDSTKFGDIRSHVFLRLNYEGVEYIRIDNFDAN